MAVDNTTINITVRDAANNLVVGALVNISIAGRLFNLTTDNTGSVVATLSLPNITVGTINIEALGYILYKNIYTISPSSNTYTIILSVDTSQIYKSVQILDQTNLPVTQAIVSVNGIVVGKTDNDGQISVVAKSGELTVQVNKSGYSPIVLSNTYTPENFPTRLIMNYLPVVQPTTQIDIPTVSNTELFGVRFGAPDPSTTSNSTTPIGAGSAASSTAINTGGTAEQEYPSEWIFPNSGNGRYFTGTQARIYIGNLFIDEIDTLYYVYNNNRIPVYGYSSANVDAFGQGRRLVQGQISLNFVSEGYLYTVLNEYKKRTADSNLSPSDIKDNTAIQNLANLHMQQKSLLTQQTNGDNTAATQAQLRSISNQILSAYSTLGSGAAASVKKVLADATTANSPSNAIIKNVPFDIIINASGGGRTTTKKLSNCLLTSNEQVWDQSDNVIKDAYGFVGVEIN